MDIVPATYEEALASSFRVEWERAMAEELASIRNQNVWELVDHKHGLNTVDTKWVYSIKYSDTGEPVAKARLVARGFKDSNTYADSDVYAPVVPRTAILWLLSTAHCLHLKMVQLDFKMAFLNGTLEEEIYVNFPRGMPEMPGKTLKLIKALYSLKIASKTWYNLLHSIFLSLGFSQTVIEPCVYFRNTSSVVAIAIIYIDDILFTTNNIDLQSEFLQAMKSQFQLKITLKPACFVGLQFSTIDGKFILHQHNYIEKFILLSGMADANPTGI